MTCLRDNALWADSQHHLTAPRSRQGRGEGDEGGGRTDMEEGDGEIWLEQVENAC